MTIEYFFTLITVLVFSVYFRNLKFLKIKNKLLIYSQSELNALSLQFTLDAIYPQEESNLIDGLRKRTRYGRPGT